MTISQKKRLIEAFRKLQTDAERGIEMVQADASIVQLMRHSLEIGKLAMLIEDALGESFGASTLLDLIGERAKTLSASKG